MDGMRANRKEIFDIGLAGPLAGLAVAIPITWIGIQQLDLTGPGYGLRIQLPLIVKWVVGLDPPAGYQAGEAIACSQLNPYFMAGWVGLLVTGLNMLPISQLDGGHVIYTLFGKPAAHWIARVFMLAVLVAICLDVRRLGPWLLMTFLVLLIGVSHPPTKDDTVPIGWLRVVIGLISLLIPLLCFNPYVLTG
jgi:membrane-associated protease RseP (regulator of RpoE activity)